MSVRTASSLTKVWKKKPFIQFQQEVRTSATVQNLFLLYSRQQTHFSQPKLSKKPSRTSYLNNNIISYCPKPYYCISTPRTSCIYFKPRIHNPNNPGWPIASAGSCPTEILAPIVKSLPSFIKDCNHTLEIFHLFNFQGENKIIFTVDIALL